ncbi:MAG: cytochrome c3 family protein [Bacteroidales bacterium]|nr:cytochrome c3 family protein [Bacteroidales bacterium]
MKFHQLSITVSIFMFFGLLVVIQPLKAQETQNQKLPNSADDHKCFKCHGHKFFSFLNEVSGKEVIKRMNPYYVIDSNAFYHSNHHTLECTDCHDAGYLKFPHDGHLQMQPIPTCLDCHEGDEVTAKFHFDEINREFDSSVHKKMYGNFQCSMCHDPHKYTVTARRDKNIKQVIIYDNEMCLSCHSNIVNYKVLSDSAPKNISSAHEWLPNQMIHFQNVRCLDCHVKVENDSMVDHQIQPKAQAVKNCVECHSKNTILMASLYKFQSKQSRSEIGFLNATILNNSYVISANRNPVLNKISLIIFGLVLVIIIVHAILRIITK